jgi:prepilin-type N-terminal cleavage/methylation domain-containing protein
MSGRRGFSLTEVVAGLTILGILAAVSVPNISSFLRSQGSNSGAAQLTAHLRLARSRAILEGNDYLVQFVGDRQYEIVDDDGGGNGVPGSAGYDAANRNNGRADQNELLLGPFDLPSDLEFATVGGIRNPFTGEQITEAVNLPEWDGSPTAMFHPNGTADAEGFVAIQSRSDIDRDTAARCRVIRLVSSTGAVDTRPAGR